jgi:hypothetical protein
LWDDRLPNLRHISDSFIFTILFQRDAFLNYSGLARFALTRMKSGRAVPLTHTNMGFMIKPAEQPYHLRRYVFT